jgi:hypothetical protein
MDDRELMQMTLDALERNEYELRLLTQKALRERLSQPDHFRDATKKVVPSDYPNSHQPVAWAKFNQGEITHSEMTDGSGCDFDLKAAGFVPLYTAREWVGLTDYELQVLDFNDPERGKLARAVEAKLKEKNA